LTYLPAGSTVAMGPLLAVSRLLEELADWEVDARQPLSLPGPLAGRQGAEALRRLLAWLPEAPPYGAAPARPVEIAVPIEIDQGDLAVAVAVAAALAQVQDRPDIGELLDAHAQDYVSCGLRCLHADDSQPPAAYRERFLTDMRMALHQLVTC
jgi:hypothetical protein